MRGVERPELRPVYCFVYRCYEQRSGMLWPILLGLGAVLCKDRVGEKQGMLLLPVLALSLAGLLGATHGYYESALLWLLRKLGNNNAVARHNVWRAEYAFASGSLRRLNSRCICTAPVVPCGWTGKF